MSEEKTLTTAQYQRKVMDEHYARGHRAHEEGRLVAWSTAMSPMEVLVAHDISLVFPENHAAACAARHVALPILEAAEAHDFSPDICAYARNTFGQSYLGKDTPGPLGPLPKPDFVLANNNTCVTVTKWYEAVGRMYDVPVFVMDIPFIHGDEQPPEHIAYIVQQLKELIALLEQKTGRKYDYDRLREVVALSRQAAIDWTTTMALARHRPTPITCFDGFTNLAPIVCLRGTPEGVQCYARLRADVEAKVAQGIGAIPNERFRLYWDNIAVWFRLRGLSDRLAARGAVLVMGPYTHNNWKYTRLDPEHPLESIALEISDIHANRGIDYRADYLCNAVDEYSIDGVIFHSARSCKPWFLGQYYLQQQVAERKGIPGVVIEGDIADERLFSDDQAGSRIDALLEMLSGNR